MDGENITPVLASIQAGDPQAQSRLLGLVYDELKRMAQANMARERPDHTLQPTALVHEAYLRLVKGGPMQWECRGHFYAAIAEAMRRILIEEARRRTAQKRGGQRERITLGGADIPAIDGVDPDTLLALDDALKKLEVEDPDVFQVVMRRYFGGLTIEEAAESMGISARTAKRYWTFARAWLQREIEGIANS